MGRSLFAAITIASSAGFLVCGYEFVRSSSNTLFKFAYGPENLPVIMALVPVAVVLALFLYVKLLSHLGPRKTLLATTLLSGVAVLGCYFLIEAGSRLATGVLYLVKEAYCVLIIEQYWSFLNSTLNTDTAKKLNGPIIGLSSLGAVIGGLFVYRLSIDLGTSTMLLFGAASVIPAALLSDIAYWKCGEPKAPEAPQERKHDLLSLKLFRSSRLLTLLLCLILITQVLSTVVGLNFHEVLQEAIPDPDKQTAYSGRFFATLNGVALFFQFILTPVLLRWVSFPIIHLIFPLAHICTCFAAIVYPSLATASFAFLLFKAFDYSLFRAAKEILYIPLSFNARYRAKEVIDVFGYRFGKGGASLFILFFQRFGVVFRNLYCWVGLAAAVVWVGIVIGIFRKTEAAQSSSTTSSENG